MTTFNIRITLILHVYAYYFRIWIDRSWCEVERLPLCTTPTANEFSMMIRIDECRFYQESVHGVFYCQHRPALEPTLHQIRYITTPLLYHKRYCGGVRKLYNPCCHLQLKIITSDNFPILLLIFKDH